MLNHTGTKQLETQRLILRPFRADDGESCLRNWAADPEIYRHISQQPRTPQDVAQWLSTAPQAYAAPDTYYWAMVLPSSGEVIGEIFVDDFSSRNRWCELDWKVAGRTGERATPRKPPVKSSAIWWMRWGSTGYRPSAAWKTWPPNGSCKRWVWPRRGFCTTISAPKTTDGRTWCCMPWSLPTPDPLTPSSGLRRRGESVSNFFDTLPETMQRSTLHRLCLCGRVPLPPRVPPGGPGTDRVSLPLDIFLLRL